MERYVDVKNYCKNICKCAGLGNGCEKSKCPIWKAPAADVEPVVRCKDCEAYQPTEGGKPFCVVHERATFADGFCYEGERREEKC